MDIPQVPASILVRIVLRREPSKRCVTGDATLCGVSQPAPRLRRIALDAAGDRHDLVVPQNEALAGALAAVGVHLAPGDRVLGPDGSAVDTGTAARDLREGGLYAVAGPPFVGAQSLRESDDRGRVAVVPWAMFGFGSAAALLATVLPGMRWIAVILIALAAVVATVSGAARRGGRYSVLAAALALAGIAATIALLPTVDDEPVLAIAVGAAAVSVLASLIGFVASSPRVRAAATPVVVIAGLFTALALVSPALGWSPAQLVIVSAAAAVVGVRAAPSLLVSVDPGYHIDYGRFMVLRWTVRGRVPEFIERVDRARVDDLVTAAEARLQSTIVMLSCFAAIGIPAALVPLTSGDLAQVIAGAVFVLWASLGLLLTSRRMAARALRTPPRVAVIIGLLAFALLAAPHLSVPAGIAVAASALFGGAVAAAAIVPLARGERSLGWSRTGDIVDSIAVALVLPAGVVAAGTLNLLQGVLAA